MQLPKTFLEQMKKLLGDSYDSYMESFSCGSYRGLRVNTLKISAEEFEKICPFRIQKIPWVENGYFYESEDCPSKHPYYYAGLYYLQEPSAMTPGDRLPIEAGDIVLDLCAAPGGKATQLGSRLMGSGLLVANDISSSRAKGLLKNIEMEGIGNTLVISESHNTLMNAFPEYFNKILVDAPCSGEGMFRRKPDMVKEWLEKGPEYYAKQQKEILLTSAGMLKPGGMILYSTCTFSPNEDEDVICSFLKQREDFKLCEIKWYHGFESGYREYTDEWADELERCIRIYPHRMTGEGHFLALLKRKEDMASGKEINEYRSEIIKKPPKELLSFLKDNILLNVDLPIKLQKSKYDNTIRAYMLPNVPFTDKKLRYLRTGLYLGDIKKNRFEPSQALAMYLKKEEALYSIDFPVNDERVLRYLKGETIDVLDLITPDMKGWCLICTNSFPLGWGKLKGGMLKNKYAPGWRLQ